MSNAQLTPAQQLELEERQLQEQQRQLARQTLLLEQRRRELAQPQCRTESFTSTGTRRQDTEPPAAAAAAAAACTGVTLPSSSSTASPHTHIAGDYIEHQTNIKHQTNITITQEPNTTSKKARRPALPARREANAAIRDRLTEADYKKLVDSHAQSYRSHIGPQATLLDTSRLNIQRTWNHPDNLVRAAAAAAAAAAAPAAAAVGRLF